MIAKLLSFWVSIPLAIVLGLLPGAWAAEWWEHNPNPPAIASGHFLWWKWDFRPLSVQLAGARADFATERATVLTYRAAFNTENAAVTTFQGAGAKLQAVSLQYRIKAQQANAWRLSLADQLASLPPPGDTSNSGLCVAAEDVLREGGK